MLKAVNIKILLDHHQSILSLNITHGSKQPKICLHSVFDVKALKTKQDMIPFFLM